MSYLNLESQSDFVLSPITDHIAECLCALFGHIACLSEAVLANQALHCHVDSRHSTVSATTVRMEM